MTALAYSTCAFKWCSQLPYLVNLQQSVKVTQKNGQELHSEDTESGNGIMCRSRDHDAGVATYQVQNNKVSHDDESHEEHSRVPRRRSNGVVHNVVPVLKSEDLEHRRDGPLEAVEVRAGPAFAAVAITSTVRTRTQQASHRACWCPRAGRAERACHRSIRGSRERGVCV
jgi:hypothetical protein